MSNVIIFKNEDNSVGIIHPAKGVTVDRLIMGVPHGLSYEVVDVSDIPTDRSFRDAWAHDTTASPEKIDLHVEKAKEVSLERIRIERKPLLESLDLEFIKALETGADTTEITTKKQDLRDATDGVKAFTRIGTTMQISSGDELRALEVLPVQESI